MKNLQLLEEVVRTMSKIPATTLEDKVILLEAALVVLDRKWNEVYHS